jgi:hypothetical protein
VCAHCACSCLRVRAHAITGRPRKGYRTELFTTKASFGALTQRNLWMTEVRVRVIARARCA